MTETSYFWANTSVGDGVLSPYTDDEFSDVWRKLLTEDRTTMGVVNGYANALVVTNPSGNTIRVATGAALVDGKFYEADANVDNTITTPSAATRQDRVVLRKSWSAQTVRVAILTGIEGGGVPALTQTDGTTWEIPLASVSITTGGSISITDERDYIYSPLQYSTTGNEWVLIEEKTIAGTETSIDFENIPSTYRHLKIIGVLRHLRTATVTELSIRINDDSGANYSYQNVMAANTTEAGVAATGDNEIEAGVIPANSATANHFGYVEIDLPYYSLTDFYKTLYAKVGSVPNATVGDFDIYFTTGQWEDTGGISSISLFSSGAAATAFKANSRICLYGM